MVHCAGVVLRVVLVKEEWRVLEREVEEILRAIPKLTGAIHVRNAVTPESLRPVVPAAGLRGIN